LRKKEKAGKEGASRERGLPVKGAFLLNAGFSEKFKKPARFAPVAVGGFVPQAA
jgi:hypothetical protein